MLVETVPTVFEATLITADMVMDDKLPIGVVRTRMDWYPEQRRLTGYTLHIVDHPMVEVFIGDWVLNSENETLVCSDDQFRARYRLHLPENAAVAIN